MSQALIQALQNPVLYPHPVAAFEIIETHISWVILTGPYAYKIKKPMNFGFLDFSTLALRRHYCEEELRLNRRFAAELYLEVIPISGSIERPRLGGAGEPLEYTVKMVQFPQNQLLDRMLERGELTTEHIDAAARIIADFHTRAATAGAGFGTATAVQQPVQENFDQIRTLLEESADFQQMQQVENWALDQANILNPIFEERKQSGRVKECHGDLHLGNITIYNGEVTPFDCIEFNENLSQIDVMSEVAFLLMDLEARGEPALANRFLNAYLECTGDYGGLRVLQFYKSYRAMVRAKVALLNLHTQGRDQLQRQQIFQQYHRYIGLAQRYMAPPTPCLILMHGYSGTGKTTVSTPLVERLGAIRLRSDVERKRLFGNGKPQAEVNSGIYSHTVSDQTFAHLADLTKTVINAGYPVILDATFLHRGYRELFQRVAGELGVPLHIVSCELDDTRIRERINQRQADGKDPSDADIKVYESQLQNADPLSAEERACTTIVDTGSAPDIEQLIAKFSTGS